MINLDRYASLIYEPSWLEENTISQLYQEMQGFKRQQERIYLYGKWHLQPRLTAWVGVGWSAESGYRNQVPAYPWTPAFACVRDQLRERWRVDFNSVLINEYRDGADCVGWHADDELTIDRTAIVSLSLGGERLFKIRSKHDHSIVHTIPLANGDLLAMLQAQTDWEHSIPKTKKVVLPRLNLTFRRYLSSN